MFVPLMLFIHLTVTGTQASIETRELGRVIDLPTTNILEDFREQESSIFEPFPEECFIKQELKTSESYFEYYSSTRSFFSKLGTQTTLDVSLQSTYSLGVTLDSVSQSTSSKESKVSGISLIVEALTEKIFLDKDCLEDETYKLKARFMEDVERLPLEIKEPWLRTSWRSYHDFFQRYGTHAITSVVRGGRIKQLSFAQSSKSYSERDFQVKACLNLAGPTPVGKVGVSACTNVTSQESSSASDVTTSDKLIIKGGKSTTRDRLLQDRTKELIEQLLDEASGEDSASVAHTFDAVWKILQNRFELGSPNYARALNLQYYYLGYLNYGCPYQESERLAIQKFDYTTRSSDKYPDYECSLAQQGCHSDDDCSYHPLPVWCSCRGQTCIRYRSEQQVTGATKETAYANTGEDWAWQGCQFVRVLRCVCANRNRDARRTVWSLPSRDATIRKAPHHHGDHYKGKDRRLTNKKKVRARKL